MLFGDYQGTRLTEGIDTGDISVPSLAERGGSFIQHPAHRQREWHYRAAQFSPELGANGDAGRALRAGFFHEGDSAIHLAGAGKISAGLDSAAQRERGGV